MCCMADTCVSCGTWTQEGLPCLSCGHVNAPAEPESIVTPEAGTDVKSASDHFAGIETSGLDENKVLLIAAVVLVAVFIVVGAVVLN